METEPFINVYFMQTLTRENKLTLLWKPIKFFINSQSINGAEGRDYYSIADRCV